MYFFASLGFILSWFIIVFLSFCFPFPYPFYLAGAIYLVVMHAKFLRLRFFACLRLDCFVSLLIVPMGVGRRHLLSFSCCFRVPFV